VSKANLVLSNARARALRKAPFLADAIYALIFWPSSALPEGVGTGVTKDGVMLYNEEIILRQWTLDDCATAIVHEAEHIRREHHRRAHAIGVADAATQDLWGWASDAELNDDLLAMKFKILDTDIQPRHFGMPDGQLAETYFLGLQASRSKPDPKPKCCGSGAGNPLPDESGPTLPADRQALLSSMRAAVAMAVVDHARTKPGSVPASLLRDCQEQLAPPKVSWQQRLRSTAIRAARWKAGQVDLTYTRVSRRQGALGFGPGIPVVRSYVAPIPLVALVQDTSMSMTSSQIASTLSEAQAILREVAEVVFVSCDAEVHGVSKLRSVKEMAAAMKGGGGTDFRPAFKAIEKMRPRPNIVVFATDAEGRFPDHRPSWCTVIWLLSSPWLPEPAPTPWGERIVVLRKES